MWRGDDFHHNGAFRLFVPNIFEAKAGDFRPATHRIHRSARYPSRVSIPVVLASLPPRG